MALGTASNQGTGNPVSTGSTAAPITTQGTATPLGIVNFNPNTGQKLANGQSVAVNPGNSTYGSNASPVATQSTTTLSSDKSNDIAGIQSTTANLKNNVGATTDANSGVTTNADGTAVQPPTAPQQSQTDQNGNPIQNPATTSTGGYVDDVYYPPGSSVPTDTDGNPVALSAQGTTDSTILNNLSTAKAQVDANTAATITGIQASYTNFIALQNTANQYASSAQTTANIRSGTSQYESQMAAGTMQATMSYGVQKISNLQAQENAAIQAATTAGENQDFKLMDEMNSEAQGVRTEKQTAAAALAKTITDAASKLADQNFATQTALTASINTVAEDAAKGGADPATLSAIASSKTVSDAMSVAGDYLQTSSDPDMAAYLEYSKQAKSQGLVPQSYTDYTNNQATIKSNLAVEQASSIAYADEAAKNAADQASGVLNTQQNTDLNEIKSQLSASQPVKDFMNVADSMAIINNLPTANLNPEQQNTLTAEVAHILSPGSTSLRGALAAVNPKAYTSGVWKLLNTAANTVGAVGNLSPAAVAGLKQIASSNYDSQQATYQQVRDDAISSSTIPNIGSMIPDYSNVGAVTPQQSVDNYVAASGTTPLSKPITLPTGETVDTTGGLIAQMYNTPGATDASVQAYIQAHPEIFSAQTTNSNNAFGSGGFASTFQ